MKKILILLLAVIFFNAQVYPLYAYSNVAAYLCEIGAKFYQNGRYEEALHEFSKALIAKPDYPPALEYIKKIKGELKLKPSEELPSHLEMVVPAPAVPSPVIIEPKPLVTPAFPEAKMIEKEQVVPKKKVSQPRIIRLEELLNLPTQSVELEQGSSILLIGKNIQRFLSTYPQVITVEKKSGDELLVSGDNFGYTHLYAWDNQGRFTLEFLVVPPAPEGPTYEELIRSRGDSTGTFKLRYSLDWASYESGRRIKTLERSSYSYYHNLSLTGPTPYGNLDSTALMRTLRKNSDLTYFTLGLTEGSYGPFKGFHLRTFDYSPGFSNLAFPGTSLRGAMFESPAFNRKIDYTVFWGREGGGRYGQLSPGLAKTKNSFLSGVDLNWDASKVQDYRFSVIHGRGRDRAEYLNPYAYDLKGSWKFNRVNYGYEAGYDSESSAHLLNLAYHVPKFNLTSEFREISKKYMTIIGQGSQVGERGGLFTLNYAPTEKFNSSSRLNVFQDRLFPSLENNNRWNEDFDWSASYAINPLTNVRADYGLINDLGRLSEYRSHNSGVTFSRTIKFGKDINTFAGYRHQESKNFSSPSSDYINEKLSAGLRFSLIGNLYYYLNKEFNWLEERFNSASAKPHVMETGIDWNGQLLNAPVNSNFRVTYRDEENASSGLSFLSGEDYIEGYGELSYHSPTNKEIYCSTRIRNVWAENPATPKRIEANFNAGMRYVWDTGVRWESVGNIEGYVFKDFNGDGLRQKDEPPLQGIKLDIGNGKVQVTDLFGYYKFKKVKGRSIYVNIDISTLPAGFVLTVPGMQEVSIEHSRNKRVDFGVFSRSQMTGFLFEDVNANNEFDKGEKGIQGAVLTLENGKRAVTDATGKYSFASVSTGEHTVTLELNSIPVYYLPKTSLIKKITLFEGVTYIYNIPLKIIRK